ncbi:MAG TPA: hypothetical protein VKD91_03010 [Pyrinomonadaceae bacterium]|nr:hypothetical protein [Pyrinomonadaceae bacterium]
MFKRVLAVFGALLAVVMLMAAVFGYGVRRATAEGEINAEPLEVETAVTDGGFSVEVLINGVPATEYAARGRRYIEAFESAEYELRIHNPSPSRVAVALAVDGLNTIDARHTSAWDAHKWVIEPYGTINIRGWQMSSENARRFYFTTERDSYGAKLGQTANLGVISAVFYRERRPITVMPGAITQARPPAKEPDRSQQPEDKAESSRGGAGREAARSKSLPSYPPPDDESAATGIGRSVSNSVQWIKMDLEPQPAGEVTIRYEYRAALVRLGIVPRPYPRPDVLDRRERSQGFEPKYCPQP